MFTAVRTFDLFGSGWLSDQFNNRLLLMSSYAFTGLSLRWLSYSRLSIAGLSLFAVFCSLEHSSRSEAMWSGSVPVPTTADLPPSGPRANFAEQSGHV